MLQKTKAIFLQVLLVTFLATLLVVAIIYAWTEPTVPPPGGNVPAPINVGGEPQSKLGRLGIGTTTLPTVTLDVDGSGWIRGGLRTNFDTYLAVISGNVGIGTSTPTRTLGLGGDMARNIGMERRTTAGPGFNLTINAGGAGSGTNLAGGNLILASGISRGTGGSNIHFQTATPGTSGSAERIPSTKMIILGNGNVGIGTATPAHRLDIEGDVRWTGTLQEGSVPWVRLTSFPSACPSGQFVTAVGGTLTCASPPGVSWPLLSTIDGTASAPAYSWSADTNMGIRRGGTDDLRLVTAGTDRLTINSAGNIGIGTTAPEVRLDVVGDVRANAFYYRSDILLKTHIQPLESALEKVLNLQGVTFNWKDTQESSIGLIAQEVERIVPEVVSGKEGEKAIDYSKLVPLLIEAIKEQQKEIEVLKSEINHLKRKIKL